jgi:hypothetical protein
LQDDVRRVGPVDELARRVAGRRQRLFHEDVNARLDEGTTEIGVRRGRRRDRHRIDPADQRQRIGVGVAAEFGRGFRSASRIAVGDRDQHRGFVRGIVACVVPAEGAQPDDTNPDPAVTGARLKNGSRLPESCPDPRRAACLSRSAGPLAITISCNAQQHASRD